MTGPIVAGLTKSECLCDPEEITLTENGKKDGCGHLTVFRI